jgi:hypothetical protein
LSNKVETIDCAAAAKVMRFALYHVEEKGPLEDEDNDEDASSQADEQASGDRKDPSVLGKRNYDGEEGDEDTAAGADENDGSEINKTNSDTATAPLDNANKRARVALGKALADKKRSSPRDARMDRFKAAMSELFDAVKGTADPITPVNILAAVNKRLSQDGGLDDDEEMYTSPEAMKLIQVCQYSVLTHSCSTLLYFVCLFVFTFIPGR